MYLLLFLFSGILYGQERKELESEKNSNIEKLKLTHELLDKTREKYLSGSKKLNIVNSGIKYRESLIDNYEEVIELIGREIEQKEGTIEDNYSLMEDLKKDYAKIVRASYRNIDDEYWMMYILSSRDINQGYQRIKYIKYLNQYRKKLFSDIQDMNEVILVEIDSLKSLKTERESVLEKLQSERSDLLQDKNTQSRLIRQLKSKEKELLAEIKRREDIQKKIEDEIRKLIEEEARKAREANRINMLTPREKIIDEDFGKNRGGLPWPTEQGIVTVGFGLSKHPVLSNIEIYNNGIDISTVENERVRAVFKGEVTKVVAIMGANYTVIIKHGNYRTIYQNLLNVNVKVGDLVETKEYIGTVGSDENSDSVLHFELWEKFETYDPEKWLSK